MEFVTRRTADEISQDDGGSFKGSNEATSRRRWIAPQAIYAVVEKS